jgi:hypothetical protein
MPTATQASFLLPSYRPRNQKMRTQFSQIIQRAGVM